MTLLLWFVQCACILLPGSWLSFIPWSTFAWLCWTAKVVIQSLIQCLLSPCQSHCHCNTLWEHFFNSFTGEFGTATILGFQACLQRSCGLKTDGGQLSFTHPQLYKSKLLKKIIKKRKKRFAFLWSGIKHKVYFSYYIHVKVDSFLFLNLFDANDPQIWSPLEATS